MRISHSTRVTLRIGTTGALVAAFFCACADGSKNDTVPSGPVVDTTSFELTLSQASLTVGDTVRPSAILVAGHDSIRVAHVAWNSVDQGVVEVDSSGLVTGLAPGNGRVRGVVGSHEAVANVTVTPAAVATVASENEKPGTSAWLTPSSKWANPTSLAMWASPYAAGPSDTLQVFIHSTKGSVTLDLFRLGWYGGQGGRLILETRDVKAIAQPACQTPDAGGPVACPWSSTIRVPIDPSWVTGLYMLKATASDGVAAHYAFVLRSAHRATFAAVVPQFTWQAYNPFGGVSLYTSHGHKVSFERPYFYAGGAPYLFENAYSLDLSVIRWLEHNKVDVSYVSDADLQSSTDVVAPLKGLVFIGHSEYWTWAEYDRVEQLRNSHKHLAFLAGNTAYWNVRLERSPVSGRPGMVVTCYKNDEDIGAAVVHERTGRFRDAPLNRPENGLIGVMFSEVTAGQFPLVTAAPPIGTEAAQFLAAAGIKSGESLGDYVRAEGDQPFDNGRGPPNLQILTRSPIVPRDSANGLEHAYYTTFFIAPSGAGVFAAGNNDFARSLESVYTAPEPRLQRLVKAVVDWMAVR